MKPSRDFCKKQLWKLWQTDFFPREDDAAVKQLVDYLVKLSTSEDHCERMCLYWLETQRKAPQVADIVMLAHEIPDKIAIPEGCRACLGTDFIIVERDGVSGVKRCQCKRGRILADKDRQRRQFDEVSPTRKPAEPITDGERLEIEKLAGKIRAKNAKFGKSLALTDLPIAKPITAEDVERAKAAKS